MSLSGAEKERLLRALEEDREFRYALMGLLGFREVLERITRIEERQQRLEERQQRLEERMARIEELIAGLLERQTRLEEAQRRLEERQARLEERMTRVEERLEKLDRTVITIAHRFGALSEQAFREAIKGILENYFGATARRWSAYDSEGLVYGYPSIVEVDVVIKDGVHILVEVKSRADTGDILELARIARLYEAVEGAKPRLAIVAGYATRRALEAAKKLGVELYTYLDTGAVEGQP